MILSIDGKTPDEIISGYRDIVSVSQPGAYLFQLGSANLLGTRGPQGSEASIQLRRNGALLAMKVARTQRTPLLFTSQQVIAHSIGASSWYASPF